MDYILATSQRHVVVNLPPSNVVIDELVIGKSITIVGCVGSSITVTKGPISIRNTKGSDVSRVEIKLVTISYTGKASSAESKTLFEVWNNTELVISDCTLKCETAGPDSAPTIGVYICPATSGAQAGSVHANSCGFNGFFTQIMCGNGGQVLTESCSFQDSGNSSIFSINPLSLCVSRTNFDRCGHAAVEAKWVYVNEEPTESQLVEAGAVV